MLKIDTKLFGCLKNHPRPGLPERRIHLISANAVFRMKGTKVDFVDHNTTPLKNPAHPLGELQKFLFGVITAANSGLIGDYENHVTQFLGKAAQLKNAFNKLTLLLPANISMVDVDHAIAVKKQGWAKVQMQTPANSVCARSKSSGIPISMN